MDLPENDYQILKLTDAFYNAYPNPPYIEMLKKNQRAYNCLLFQTHYNYFICIPYRSEISHRYAYLFKKSARSRQHKSGLDYTKIVIINKNEYIAHIMERRIQHPSEFKRRYTYSSLQYFHKELGLKG